MSIEEKLKKLELLTKLHTSIAKTCMNLYQDGDQVLASKIEEINLFLAVAVEELTHKTLEEWIALSQQFISKTEPQLVSIEEDLNEINKNLKDSQKIANTIGKIDKAIKSVAKQIT